MRAGASHNEEELMRYTLSLLAAAALLALAAMPAAAGSMDVDLKASDGTMLKATYMSPGKPGPAMLLIHQCNLDRSSWTGIASQFVDAGVHVLTMDLRGFGGSDGADYREAGGFGPFLKTASGDVDMAFDYLSKQEGVDTARMAAGGASCGAVRTADLAARRPVKALMLLSGPPSEAAVANIAAKSDLAVFAAAASGDPITAGVDKQLKSAVKGSKHPNSTAKIYEGPEHGVPMFAKNADLEPALVSWLKTELTGK